MSFGVSPAVQVREFDVSTVVPEIGATPACFAGVFRWGPLETRTLLDSENTLVDIFQKPSNLNGETFFTASSFLSYGGQLIVVRAANSTGVTYQKSFSGNSTNLAFVSGNTFVQISNTANLAIGQYVLYSNNSALNPSQSNGVQVMSVNSTGVVLNFSPTANVQSATLVFRDHCVYSAVAQETNTQNIQWSSQIVKNIIDFSVKDGTFDSTVKYVARYPGSYGNSLRVNQCDTYSQFASNTNLQPNAQINATSSVIVANVGSNTVTVTVAPADTSNATQVTSANTVAVAAQASLSLGDLVQHGNTTMGFQFLKTTAISNVTNASNVFSFTISTDVAYQLAANSSSNTLNRYWEFYNALQEAPRQSTFQLAFGNTSANDEMHVVIVDDGGRFTGIPGTVLEVYSNVSRAIDAKNDNNTTNYYKQVINTQSKYVWVCNDRTTALSANAALLASSTASAPMDTTFYGGSSGKDEANIELGALITAYSYFISAEDVDISLIVTGKARGAAINSNTQLATWLINNIAEKRKDCVVFNSPDYNNVVIEFLRRLLPDFLTRAAWLPLIASVLRSCAG